MGLNETESLLVAKIRARADAMLTDLRDLVAMPTGHGHREGLEHARSWITARLTALGASVTRVAGEARPDWLREGVGGLDGADILVADRLSVLSQGTRILVSGHLDTVHDPRGGFRELSSKGDGTLCGPGAVDMKGGIIVALHALEALEACGVGVRWSFVLNADEETGSFASAQALSRVAHDHDLGLVVEPAFGDGNFVTSRAGSAQFRLDAFGREAHAGRDAASGVSAVEALCKAVVSVLAHSDPAVGRTLNIGPLEGGTATNIVPGHAVAWGNGRYRTHEQRSEVEHAINAVRVGSSPSVPRVETRIIHNRPAKPATREVDSIAAFAIASAEDLGVKAGCASSGGVSDANLLQAAGLPCLDGLGVRGGNLHRTDEFVVEASLVERASIFALLVARIASHRGVPWSR